MALTRRQAFELNETRLRSDRDELLRRLDRLMGKTGGNGVTARRSVAAPAPSQPVHEEPAPPPVPSPPPGRTWAGVAIIATGIFLGLVGLGIWGSFESAAAY